MGEPELLTSCYRSCFAIAQEHGLRTLAFPAISCGVYRFPVDLATEIAWRETVAELERNAAVVSVVFACFDDVVFAAYRRVVQRFSGGPASQEPPA